MSTYHFYVDDYRFEKLFKDPIALLTSGCKAIVEPNVSIHDQTPIAYGIYQIYRKRYLTRYLQECGMQVWVDLNVSHRFAEYNRLGVPDGYNAFFTRGVAVGYLTSKKTSKWHSVSAALLHLIYACMAEVRILKRGVTKRASRIFASL